MTDPFMRVDISQPSRDFHPIALEPGLPVLDRSNSNGQTIRQWLGALVAEPERKVERSGPQTRESIDFYVRDEEGRRIDSVFCIPVTDKDLTGELAKEFAELRRRAGAAQPQSPNEQLIHRVVNEQVQQLNDASKSRDRRCCLFKYRDGKNKLHLVWAPGYSRRDHEPAAPFICTNPKCSHLFLQRRDSGAKCPVCQSTAPAKPQGDKSPRSLMSVLTKFLAFLFFIAVGVIGTIWWQQQKPVPDPAPLRLTVEPANWTGPVGSQVEFAITRIDGKNSELVTTSAAATVANPKVLSVKPYMNVGNALSPGETEVTFYVGTLTVQAKITVGRPNEHRPTELILKPSSLTLGVGTTAQMKLIGKFEGGHEADLTDIAEWETQQKSKFFVHKGRIEGEEPGQGTLQVRYRFDDTSEPMDQTAEIEVKGDLKYKSLKLTTDPQQPVVGQPAFVHVVAVTDGGEEFSLDESKELTIEVSPSEFALKGGSEISTQKEGSVEVAARFQDLTSELRINIAPPGEQGPLDVSPKKLELKVGELAKLSVRSAGNQSLQIKSQQPEIAEVTAKGQIVGRSVGDTELEISDGGEPVKVPVSVSIGEWTGILIEPARLSLRANETATLHIYGVLDQSNRVELAGDQVTWASLPRSKYVGFEPARLQVTGHELTGDSPERITARHKSLEASAEIEVVGSVILTLSPEGSVEIPQGQKQTLIVRSKSGGSAPVDIPADRIEWITSPEKPPFEIKNGVIYPPSDESQMRLKARYQGTTSNEIRVSSVAQPPLTITARAVPSQLAAGAGGFVVVSAASLAGPVELNEAGLRFVSLDPEKVTVDESTGAFLADRPGTVAIRVTHAAAAEPAEVSITIGDGEIPRPSSLRLVSSQGSSIQLPMGAEFFDWRVEAVGEDGTATDVSDQATLVVEDASTMQAVVIRQRKIVGVNAGTGVVQAAYGGIQTTGGLRFEVTNDLLLDEIRIVPSTVSLKPGDSTLLRAEGFKGGRSLGDITNRTDLEWKSADQGLVTLTGPQITAGAKQTGTTTVTVSYGSLKSKPASIKVGEGNEVGRLEVFPSQLRMGAGETVHLGQEIKVQRNNANFSDSCEVVAPSGRVVAFDENKRVFHAQSPGRSQIMFIQGDQTAVLEIEVGREQDFRADSRLIIEPSAGRLAVGEEMSLRVFVIDKHGRRSPVEAALTSRAPEIGQVSGSAIQGVAPGEFKVVAALPGINQPGEAIFVVNDDSLDQLTFQPGAMTLHVGQRKSFDVFGVAKRGRVKLGISPEFKLAVSEADRETIELSEQSRDILGLKPGTATVIATWKSGLERKLSVTVKPAAPVTEIVIQPDQATVEVNGTLDYQVLARRGDRLEALQPLDGVTLKIEDGTIAVVQESEFRITGLKAGKTQVTAEFGMRRVVGQLTVLPAAQPPAPLAKPERLRFLANFRQMDLGYPGDPVRVVQVMSDGKEQDVDHLVTLTVQDPTDIVDIEQTASGPVIRPKKVGQTHVDASLGDLRTQRPLLVEVVSDDPRRQPELRSRPRILRLQLGGEPGRFERAEILPAGGGTPIPVPFIMTATPNRVIEILPNQSIRGLAEGTAAVTLTANDPDGKYPGLAASATVEVIDPEQKGSGGTAPSRPLPPRLILTGPSETSTGAEVQLRVEREADGQMEDVTNRAQFVMIDDEEQLAQVRPGGSVLAQSPGRIHIQAVLDNLTSATHEIVIRPIGEFERIELEVARGRIGEREARPYKLWGSPKGGGARQDLTNLVTEDDSDPKRPQMVLQVLEPNPGTKVVVHRPGVLKARGQRGRFSSQIRLGDKLETEKITFEIAGGDDVPSPERLRVEPSELVLRTGEVTPPLKILVASRGDRAFRNLDSSLAEITSSNPEILTPAEEGRFTASQPGQAKIKVAYQGLEETIAVNVKFNPFAEIALGPDIKFVNETFMVNLEVTAGAASSALEYRVTLPKGQQGTDWVRATKAGNKLTASLSSPRIPLIRDQKHYSVIIEAKKIESGEVERQPYSFRLRPITNSAESKEKQRPAQPNDRGPGDN